MDQKTINTTMKTLDPDTLDALKTLANLTTVNTSYSAPTKHAAIPPQKNIPESTAMDAASKSSENIDSDSKDYPMFSRYKCQIDALEKLFEGESKTDILFYAVNHYYQFIFKQQ